MDLDALRSFIRLAETLHFGRASRACNISPSTMSRLLRRLEQQAGTALLERTNRSVTLTPAGSAFLAYARETISRWDALQHRIDEQQATLRGELTMCCTITGSYGVLPDILMRFRAQHPSVQIRLLTSDSETARQSIISGEADVAVAAIPDHIPDRLAFHKITDVHLRFVAPVNDWPHSADLGRTPIPWQRIPLIVAEKGMARRRINSWLRRTGTRPLIYAQASGNEAILCMVSLGFGVGVVPGLVLENTLLRRSVQPLNVRPVLRPYGVGVCTLRRRADDPLVRAFLQAAHR